MSQSPLVSICMPTFNGAKFLEQALNSVAHQSYKNIELVVSDDASQDRTLSIVREFQKRVNFPVYILSHSPGGIGANWNNCIINANGEYIKFLFQDDCLFPGCVEELLTFLLANEEVSLVACKRKIIVEGENSEEIENWLDKYGDLQKELTLNENETYLLDKGFLKDGRFWRSPENKIGEPSTVLFKKSILKKTGLFREDIVQVLDFEFYFRLLKYSKIAILNKELAAFRVHPAQATSLNKNRISADYHKYHEILYRDFFWYFSFRIQKKLFQKYNRVGKLYNYIRN